MSAFLQGLREDLLSRRILPLLILVSAVFLAALGYALLGGGGEGTPLSAATGGRSASGGLSVSAAPENPEWAIAETADGTGYAPSHDAGAIEDPFLAVPGSSSPTQSSSSLAPLVSSSTSTGSSTGTSGGTNTGGASAGGSRGSLGKGGSKGSKPPPVKTPKSAAKPAPPEKLSDTVYAVSLLFEEQATETSSATGPTGTVTGKSGTVTGPSGSSGEEGVVHREVQRGYELPSGKEPLLVFAGILQGGEYAIFKVIGEIFPSTGNYCLPGEVECQAIKLPVGVKFHFFKVDGQASEDLLEVSQIDASTAAPATAKHDHELQQTAGIALLGGPEAPLPGGLRYSVDQGLLVPAAG